MANKTVEYIQPVSTDVSRIILNFANGEVQSAIVEAKVRNTGDATTRAMQGHVDRENIPAQDITDFEALTPKGATVVSNQNGF